LELDERMHASTIINSYTRRLSHTVYSNVPSSSVCTAIGGDGGPEATVVAVIVTT